MKKLLNKNYIVRVIFLLAVIVSLVIGIFYFLQYQKTQKLLKNPTQTTQTEAESLINKVGQIIELPKDEPPTIATVSDINKLKDQAFFARAQNGFKVLIYSKAKKAILYDPTAHKIIEVATLNMNQPDVAQTTPMPISPSISPPTTTITAPTLILTPIPVQ